MGATQADFGTRRPKARKPYQCQRCLDEIVVGEVYARSAGIYDGSFYSRSMHEDCLAASWRDSWRYEVPCPEDHARGVSCTDEPVEPPTPASERHE